MKINKWCVPFITGMLVLCTTISVYSQDWQQWRGSARDGKVDGFVEPGKWPPEMRMLWRDSVGTGDATPVLVGNKLYVFSRQGEQEVILCLTADRGTEQWRNSYNAPPVTGAGARHPGPRSTPVVMDGKIVTLGASGILSCLDAASGELLWRKDPFPGVVPMFFTSMSPMIADGLCIAHLGGPGKGAIIAYDVNNGFEKWRWSDEGPDYGSPVLLETEGIKQIVTLTEKSIVGINLADGKLLWKLPFVPERRAYNAATPVIKANTVIYTGAGRGTRAVNIQKQGQDFAATELWSNADLSVQFNTPVLKDDLIYGYSNTGRLYCLDALTGKTAWSDTVIHERSGFAAILDAGPVIMALPASSDLIVIKPDRSGYRELAKMKVADSPVYATPVIAGSRIYIRDEKTIALWEIR